MHRRRLLRALAAVPLGAIAGVSALATVIPPRPAHAYLLPTPHVLRKAAARLAASRGLTVTLAGEARPEGAAVDVEVSERWSFGAKMSVEVTVAEATDGMDDTDGADGTAGTRAARDGTDATDGTPGIAGTAGTAGTDSTAGTDGTRAAPADGTSATPATPRPLRTARISGADITGDPALLPRAPVRQLLDLLFGQGDPSAVMQAIGARRDVQSLALLGDRVMMVLGAAADDRRSAALWVDNDDFTVRRVRFATDAGDIEIRLDEWEGPITRGRFPHRLIVTLAGRPARRLSARSIG